MTGLNISGGSVVVVVVVVVVGAAVVGVVEGQSTASLAERLV